MSISSSKEKLYKALFGAVLLVYGILLFYLIYRQLLVEAFVPGPFESDTVAHVYLAVEEHYYHSLAAFIYLLLYKLPFAVYTTAFLLTAVTLLSIVATVKLLKLLAEKMGVKLSEGAFYLGAFCCNIHTAFYVKAVNRPHYIGYQCANMWHNSTYLFMRLFAILTVIVFIKLYGKYREGLSVAQWLGFTGLLMITTGFKASFLTVFAPVMAVLLLKDLVNKTKFSKVLVFGLTVIPSLGVMYAQSLILGGESNGFAIAPFEALSMRGDHPKVSLVLSVAFPLAVLAFNFKELFKEKLYFWTYVLWAVGFLEVFLFIETGERALDGNFLWGYSIALFFLFAVSLVKAVKSYLLKRDKTFYKVVFIGQMMIFSWHVLSGMWYFYRLLRGITYFE